MEKDVQVEFEEKIKTPIEVDNEKQKNKDNKKGYSIITGSQEVFVNPYGKIVFEWPNIGLAMKGDQLMAEFKSSHLRKGDLMTEAQLLAIYNRPISIEIDGKEIVVGNGVWTSDDERRIQTELPSEIKEIGTKFDAFREEVQELETKLPVENKEIMSETDKKNLEMYNIQRDHAQDLFRELRDKKLEFLELQARRTQLFATSLEELSVLEKLKLYAPHCIKHKESGKPVWNSIEEMLNSGYEAINLIGLFSMFLKGADVSFFGDTPDDQTT